MSGEGTDVKGRLRAVLRDRYREDIQELVAEYPENRSIYLDILDLHDYDPALTNELLSHPEHVLRKGRRILASVGDEFERVNLRIRNHPGLLAIGSIGVRHIGELVTVEGVVRSIDRVEARAIVGAFACTQCETLVTVPYTSGQLSHPQFCQSCESRSAFEFRSDQSTFIDIQCIEVVSPGEEPSAATWSLPVYLDDDLVNTLDESTQVHVTGIVRLVGTDANDRFSFSIDAISIDEEPDAPPTDAKDLQEVIRSRWEFALDTD